MIRLLRDAWSTLIRILLGMQSPPPRPHIPNQWQLRHWVLCFIFCLCDGCRVPPPYLAYQVRCSSLAELVHHPALRSHVLQQKTIKHQNIKQKEHHHGKEQETKQKRNVSKTRAIRAGVHQRTNTVGTYVELVHGGLNMKHTRGGAWLIYNI